MFASGVGYSWRWLVVMASGQAAGRIRTVGTRIRKSLRCNGLRVRQQADEHKLTGCMQQGRCQ
jgi:hypothetical protein